MFSNHSIVANILNRLPISVKEVAISSYYSTPRNVMIYYLVDEESDGMLELSERQYAVLTRQLHTYNKGELIEGVLQVTDLNSYVRKEKIINLFNKPQQIKPIP